MKEQAMAKRRFKSKKVRIAAIGAALVTGAAVMTLMPSANAATSWRIQYNNSDLPSGTKSVIWVGPDGQSQSCSNVSSGSFSDFSPIVEVLAGDQFGAKTFDGERCTGSQTGPTFNFQLAADQDKQDRGLDCQQAVIHLDGTGRVTWLNCS